jgi:phosphoglycolate phosphatase-like HAD superfamily hydrolase
VEIDHIVWDWNGTLFDDGDALVLATIDAFSLAGLPEVTRERYQAHFARPISDFYDRLAGRTLPPADHLLLDGHFQRSYARRSAAATVHRDAVGALTAWRDSNGTQSLLSMYPHEQLLGLAQLRTVAHFFARVDGMSVDESPRKEPHLRRHLAALGVDVRRVLVVGDSVDDMHAAEACGVRRMLYHPAERALLSPERVRDLAVPVTHDLPGAVRWARLDGRPTGGSHGFATSPT